MAWEKKEVYVITLLLIDKDEDGEKIKESDFFEDCFANTLEEAEQMKEKFLAGKDEFYGDLVQGCYISDHKEEREFWVHDCKRLYVDMDGTLAVFTPVNQLETLYEKGYFLNQKPHENVVFAIKEIIANHPEIEVHILSAYLTDSKYALQEKNAWLDTYLPEVKEERRVFVPCGSNKGTFIQGLSKSDVLLDDYTINLNQWEPPGTGIKLITDINHTKGSWTKDCIRYDRGATDLAQKIVNVMEDKEHIRDTQIKVAAPLKKNEKKPKYR